MHVELLNVEWLAIDLSFFGTFSTRGIDAMASKAPWLRLLGYFVELDFNGCQKKRRWN